MILNGSPRAPKSNSRQYAEIFIKHCKAPAEYFTVSKTNHAALCERLSDCQELLLVFPLYADSLPSGLLAFLKYLEAHPPVRKPVVSVLINCGFLEPQQNDTALRIIQFFCRKNGYRTGSILSLGSGEAILRTPFRCMAVRAIKQLARSIATGNYRSIQTTMPLCKRVFIWASTRYWIGYGKKFNVSREQMKTTEIE